MATVACASAAAALGRLAVAAAEGVPAPDAMVGAAVLALGAVAAAVLGGGCAMLTATALAAALGHPWSRAEALAHQVLPTVLRRALTVGVGAGMSLGLGTTALADDVDVDWQVTSGVAQVSPAPIDLGPSVSLTSAPAPATGGAVPPAASPAGSPAADGSADVEIAAAPATDVAAAAPVTVVVQAGDSLWGITAALLPPGSPDAAIAAAWPALYAANEAVVGPDPGLIHPGDVLTVPAGISA